MPEDKITEVKVNNETREARFTLLREYGYGIKKLDLKIKVIKYLEKEQEGLVGII